VIPENIVRDFLQTIVNAGNYVFDINNTGNAIGLDLFLHNLGAANITISVNGQPAITVLPGAVYALSSTKWWLVAIVAAVNYDLQMAGVRVPTLRAKGIL
jgi:hypothetical protein